MYNTANIIERGFDFSAPTLSEEEMEHGYQVGELDKSKYEYREADKVYKNMLKDTTPQK